jgi:hypothetical protein
MSAFEADILRARAGDHVVGCTQVTEAVHAEPHGHGAVYDPDALGRTPARRGNHQCPAARRIA